MTKPRTYKIGKTEHPNAEDYRNRAERAEAALAEHLATCDSLPLAVGMAMAAKRIEELEARQDK
jgi:hypothetical protein